MTYDMLFIRTKKIFAGKNPVFLNLTVVYRQKPVFLGVTLPVFLRSRISGFFCGPEKKKVHLSRILSHNS